MTSAFLLEGSSMLPVFKPGETVLVRAAAPGSGDCAVYSYKGRTLLHRVLKTGPGGAWFGDDAGRLEPHFVPWGEIKGLALGRHPLEGGVRGLLYCRLRRAAAKLLLNA
jgi:hypothetical protein